MFDDLLPTFAADAAGAKMKLVGDQTFAATDTTVWEGLEGCERFPGHAYAAHSRGMMWV